MGLLLFFEVLVVFYYVFCNSGEYKEIRYNCYPSYAEVSFLGIKCRNSYFRQNAVEIGEMRNYFGI